MREDQRQDKRVKVVIRLVRGALDDGADVVLTNQGANAVE